MTAGSKHGVGRRFSRTGAPRGGRYEPRRAAPFALATSLIVAACSGGGASPSGGEKPAQDKPTEHSEPGVRTRDVAIAKISHELSATFHDGDFAFDISMREADGLGPLYTRTSCNACHDTAARGPGLVQKMSVVDSDGVTPSPDQSLLPFGTVEDVCIP